MKPGAEPLLDAPPPDWLDSLQRLAPRLVHEFRNPLSGILGSSQMLARLIDPEGPAREYIQIVEEEARKLEGHLARLAEIGRLRHKRFDAAAPLDLHALLTQTLLEIKAACDACGVRQVTAFGPRVLAVRGDSIQLGRACAEILRNGLEAMPHGGTLRVAACLAGGAAGAAAGGPSGAPGRLQDPALRPSDPAAHGPDRRRTGWVQIEFSDTGAGMTEEVRQQAFEPFFSTRPRALGMGLSLAQAIALAHGGRIRLGCLGGQGLRVILMLPAATDGDAS
ncbi:MAG TPA: ATP-binding protein [Candidatus Acidoferrum sp.]|nr:ATP-binding protein [Candidatus Acidoferrum sp.]